MPDQPSSIYRPLDTVFIVGGTHGNERTGVSLIRHWQHSPVEIQRETFKTHLLLANPQAVQKNTRFIDRDLNRSFLPPPSGSLDTAAYETGLAREIRAKMATKHSGQRTFAIDMHTTTSHMGVTLITNTDTVNLAVASAVRKQLEDVRIYCFADSQRINSCLRAAANGGIGVEIGPIPQGVIRYATIETTRRIVLQILTIIDAFNQGNFVAPDPQTTLYLHDKHIFYPDKTSGHPPVCIHPEIEGHDFERLEPGQPIFHDLSGRSWSYEGTGLRYPVFINEAAYYHENIAFSLTRKMALAELMSI